MSFEQAIKDAAADISSMMPSGMQHGTGTYEKWVHGAIQRAFERHGITSRPEGGALEECTIKRDALHLVVSALAGKLMLENETLVGMLTQAEEELRAKRWLS